MFLIVFTVFPLCMPKSKQLLLLFAPLLFYKEQGEHFALVALYKRVAVSNSLPSLFKKEQNRDSLFGKERITFFFFCSHKTSDLLEKPKSKFPTLLIVTLNLQFDPIQLRKSTLAVLLRIHTNAVIRVCDLMINNPED